MRILIKFPTRSRPQQFLKTLRGWLDQATDPANIAVLVSCDVDDATMTDDVIKQAEAMHPAVIVLRGTSANKIAACNRDLPEYQGDWQVVLLVSDDTWCRRKGWDTMIREHMTRHFPDTNGALWFFDGSQRKINTLECVGRKRYENFHYLYHPSYFSFFSDNEQSEVGVRDKKLVFIEQQVSSHEHPAWGQGMKQDALYQRNNKYWAGDEANYHRRKALGFPA